LILFYVSGHGFGHATRTRAVIDALRDRRPNIPVAVRSLAPDWLFPDIEFQSVRIDPPVFETAGGLSVDTAASAKAVREFASTLPDLVRNEASWVRSANVRAIFADIPFAAGFIGEAAGVPVIAGGNFLWNWILEGEPGIEVIAEGYSKCRLALRYPLSHDEGWEVFPRSEQVPLVTPRSERSRTVIRTELGLGDSGPPVVLIAGRAALDDSGRQRLRESCPGFRFLNGRELPNYHDLVRASDAVVSKAGYSIVAECIAEGKPLLYPPRSGFREEDMLLARAARLLRMAPIEEEAWRAGEWGEGLRRLLALPEPPDFIDTHGARTCAEILIRTAV
jgi:L-arabinokinase